LFDFLLIVRTIAEEEKAGPAKLALVSLTGEVIIQQQIRQPRTIPELSGQPLPAERYRMSGTSRRIHALTPLSVPDVRYCPTRLYFAMRRVYFRFEHPVSQKLFRIPINFTFYRDKKNITFFDANRMQTPINTHFLKIKKYNILPCANFTLQLPNVKKLAF
jgi:hypothetical protein